MRVRQPFALLVAACVAASLALLAPPAAAASGWTTAAPLPVVRSGLVAVTAPDGRIYVTAGYQTGSFGQAILDARTDVYDPGADSWSAAAPIPTARSLPGAALASDGRIYVAGGHTGGGLGYSGVTEAYDTATGAWTSGLATMPTGRYEVAAATAGQGAQERVYALGGFNQAAVGGSLATVEAYDPATDTWATVAPLPTARRGLAAVRGADGLLYAIGGSPASGSPHSNAVDVYDPATDTWSSRAPLPMPRAYHAAALGADGLIYVAGGLGAGANVDAYDPASDTWRTVAPLLTPRYGLAAAASGGRVYAIGGQVSTVAQDKVEALVLAGATVAPSSLNFGDQEAGTPGAAQDVTVSSDGTLPLGVTGVTVTGGAAGDFAVTADGCTGNSFPPGDSCTVSVTFTPSAAGARSATLVVATTSAAGTHTVALSGTGVITDATPPTLDLPADIVVDAVDPTGAAVSYTVTATDAESTVVSIDCSPASGSLFPIGTTTVSCTATDSRGNTSAPGTFDVTVQGGAGQLDDLLADVQGVGPGRSLAAKVESARAALAAGDTAGACAALDSLLAEVRAQSDKKIPVAQAQAITADATRIKTVIGCP
jgi:hypothetical protein